MVGAAASPQPDPHCSPVEKKVKDEIAEVLRCLRQSIAEPVFATVLVLLIGSRSASRPCSHSSHFLTGGERETKKATRE